jgi:CRP-like cAMP-binding protein
VGTLNEKLIHFIALRSQNPGGEKTLQITMEDWAGLIDETRINLSRLLNELQNKELIQLKRKEFFIPDFEKLTNYLIEHD